MEGMEAWKQKKCSITTLHSTRSEQKGLVLTYYDSNCKEHCNYCGFMFYILPSLLKENHNDCNKPDIVYKSKCFIQVSFHFFPAEIQVISRESTVMRFQQFQSTWNKNLPNLKSQDQTVAHVKADITS